MHIHPSHRRSHPDNPNVTPGPPASQRPPRAPILDCTPSHHVQHQGPPTPLSLTPPPPSSVQKKRYDDAAHIAPGRPREGHSRRDASRVFPFLAPNSQALPSFVHPPATIASRSRAHGRQATTALCKMGSRLASEAFAGPPSPAIARRRDRSLARNLQDEPRVKLTSLTFTTDEGSHRRPRIPPRTPADLAYVDKEAIFIPPACPIPRTAKDTSTYSAKEANSCTAHRCFIHAIVACQDERDTSST